jgi:arylsulfatase
LGLFDDDLKPARHAGPTWDSLSAARREDLDSIMAAYAACIDSIDQNVGKLTALLESLDQIDDTLILFLSNNGACQERGKFGVGDEEMVKDPPLETTEGVSLGLCWANACNTPFRLYKHFVHEGGACTPMIVHWPEGIADVMEGKFVRSVAYLPDIMATCIELAAAEYPSEIPACEGISLSPLIRGVDESIHFAPIFGNTRATPRCATASGRW